MVLLLFQHTFLPILMWSCLLQGRLVPEWHLFPQSSSSVSLLGSTGILIHLEKFATSGNLGFEYFQPSLDISDELYISSFCISVPRSVQNYGRTCHRSIQTSSFTLLDGGSLASHSSQHVGKHSSSVSYSKRFCHGYFSRPCAEGSDITACNLLLAHRHVLAQTRVLFLCLSGSGRDDLSIYS